MAFNINDILGNYNAQDDQAPIPMRPGYDVAMGDIPPQPAPMNPIVKDHLMKLMKKDAPPVAAAAPAPQAVAPIAPPDAIIPSAPDKPSATQLFNSNYGDDALKKAQQSAQDQKEGLGWSQFAAGVGDALAGKSSAQSAQNFDNIRQGIDAKTVGAFEKQKAGALQNIATQKTLEGSDPNSAKSKVVQDTVRKLWGDKFTDAQISQMTSDDADLIYKPMELKSKLDQTKATQEMAHEDRMMKNETFKQSQADRIGAKQGDYYQKAVHDINSFRGNTAVQIASNSLTNAKNALSLSNKGKLSTDQLHMFASEMGKLAMGGVPGGAEIEALVPDTMKSRMAKTISFFTNNPSDADAQAFIDNNKQYLNELVDNYSGVVDKYQQNIMDGYSKKLSPENMAELHQKYPARAQHQDSAKPKTVSQNGHTYTLNPQTGEYE